MRSKTGRCIRTDALAITANTLIEKYVAGLASVNPHCRRSLLDFPFFQDFADSNFSSSTFLTSGICRVKPRIRRDQRSLRQATAPFRPRSSPFSARARPG